MVTLRDFGDHAAGAVGLGLHRHAVDAEDLGHLARDGFVDLHVDGRREAARREPVVELAALCERGQAPVQFDAAVGTGADRERGEIAVLQRRRECGRIAGRCRTR